MTDVDDLPADTDDLIESLERVRDSFDPGSDEYADVHMTIQYIRDPDFYIPDPDHD